jgi:hypothetical protein
MQLVRSRTLHILAAENTAREYGSRISSNEVMQLSAEDVDAMPLPDDVKYAIKANVAVVKAISEQIKMLEKRIQEQVISSAEYRLLRSVPGIGKTLAPIILLETGPIERFKEVGQLRVVCPVRGQRALQQRQEKKEKATPNPATSTWLGHLLMQPTLRGVITTRHVGSTSARRQKRTRQSPRKRSPTNWPERATTS